MDTQDLQRMLAHESPMRAAEAARRCGVSVGALVRWIRKGKLLPDGGRRRLEGYQAGRSWMTTVEALARFLSADGRQPTAVAAASDPERQRRAKADMRRLEAALARM